MKSIYKLSLALVLLIGGLNANAAEKKSAVKAAAAPAPAEIEVVFVLDTTGSMGGLIQAAKEKIWAIANTLATTKPATNTLPSAPTSRMILMRFTRS